MRTGSGLKANVLKESNFLNVNLPKSKQHTEYHIGIGDKLSFTLMSEYTNGEAHWSTDSTPTEYLICVGDELTFIQQNNISTQVTSVNSYGFPNVNEVTEETIQKTSGFVGTNGDILLLGLGNISVGNRSLTSVRTDVRNILIRDGKTPNFQLEITQFRSKKAYLTSSFGLNKVIKIENIPLKLHEVVLSSGISQTAGSTVIITLTRNSKEFRITAKQLMGRSIPDIFIQDGDNIDIKFVKTEVIMEQSTVDSNGIVLLSGIGSLKAKGKTISELKQEIKKILLNDGLKPDFQLEIFNYNSKHVYLTVDNISNTIALTNDNISLKDLLLKSSIKQGSGTSLSLFTLTRNGKEIQITSDQIFDIDTKDIWLQDGDQIRLELLDYKPGQVFTLSGSNGNARVVPISPSIRETLADILFVQNGALNNMSAQRSEVYLLRGQKPSKAYHLDAQNVSRILVAAKMELRPNDIIFVAERPIISFTRTLSEITPLRILLRDIQNNNIP